MFTPKTEEERRSTIDAQAEKILAFLKNAGVEVTPEGCRYRFPYKGMQVDFVAQAIPMERLFVTMYRLPHDEEEKKFLDKIGQVLHREPGRREEFRAKYLYEYMMLDGKEATSLLGKVLEKADEKAALLEK